jgi:hypothetical protein
MSKRGDKNRKYKARKKARLLALNLCPWCGVSFCIRDGCPYHHIKYPLQHR